MLESIIIGAVFYFLFKDKHAIRQMGIDFVTSMASLVYEEHKVDYHAHVALSYYVNKYMTPAKNHENQYYPAICYVRPEKIEKPVLFRRPISEVQSKHYFGRWPVWIKITREHVETQQEAEDEDRLISIKFIRGTINVEELLSEAIEEQCKEEQEEKDNYFLCENVTGHIGSSDRRSSGPIPEPQGTSVKSIIPSVIFGNYFHEFVPLRYSRDELCPVGGDDEEGLNTLALDAWVEDEVNRLTKWMSLEKEFEKRGCPWRTNILLHGPNGTGKSKFCKLLGKHLGIPVVFFSLPTFSDKDFMCEWEQKSEIYSPAILVLEEWEKMYKGTQLLEDKKRSNCVSFHTVMQCLDGSYSKKGIITCITANDISGLDHNMGYDPDKIDGNGNFISTRPGRIRRFLHFGPLKDEGKLKIARRILTEQSDIDLVMAEFPGPVTGDVFEKRCQDLFEARIGKDFE